MKISIVSLNSFIVSLVEGGGGRGVITTLRTLVRGSSRKYITVRGRGMVNFCDKLL